MSFIFRTVFWLALAIVAIPPEARLGGNDTADFRDVDLELELHNAAFAVWSMASNAMISCEANAQVCKSATDLWLTTWDTVGKIATQAQDANTQFSEELHTAQAEIGENPEN